MEALHTLNSPPVVSFNEGLESDVQFAGADFGEMPQAATHLHPCIGAYSR